METEIADLPDQDLRKEMVSRYTGCVTHYSKWKVVAKEDYRFSLGDQWTEEERNILADQKRPAYTYNRIKPIIELVSGYQRENSGRIKVSPEGGEDTIFSEVIDKVLASIDKWSKLTYKLGYLWDDGARCGKGHLEAVVSYDQDPIRGELGIANNGPYEIMVDPECREYDINEGAEYLFKTRKYTKQKLKNLFPEKKTLIDGFVMDTDDYIANSELTREGDDDDYGNRNSNTNYNEVSDVNLQEGELEKDTLFTVKEYWYKKYVEKHFILDQEEDDVVSFSTKKEAEDYKTENNLDREIFTRTVTEMNVAMMVCGHILRDGISPFEPHTSKYPIFRYIADWSPSAESEELRVQGITRALKDPQRDKNKTKSQYAHILNTQSNSGWIGDEDALSAAGWEDLEKMGSAPGITVKKKKGRELREITPKGPSSAHIEREQKADEEFYKISNVNPSVLGAETQALSGKAMGMRIRQSVLSLVRMFTNYRYTKESVGQFTLEVVPSLFDSKKVMKIIGQKYMSSVKNEFYPDGLREEHIKAFLAMIKDHKYNVEVTEADQSRTIRDEIFEQLLELAKTPQGQLIPLETLIEYLGISNSDEIKEKIRVAREAAQQAQ